MVCFPNFVTRMILGLKSLCDQVFFIKDFVLMFRGFLKCLLVLGGKSPSLRYPEMPRRFFIRQNAWVLHLVSN